jgi:PAS domain S-box-containing protein
MTDTTLIVFNFSYFVSGVLGLVLAGVVSRNLDKPGSPALFVANLGFGFWSMLQLLTAVSVLGLSNTQLGIAFSKILYPIVATTVTAIFVFVLEYTGRERFVTWPVLAVLAVYPLTVAVFSIFNPGGLFYTNFAELVQGVGEDTTHLQGPAFKAHTIMGYVLSAAVFTMVLELLVRSGEQLYRGQAIALLFGLSAPVFLNILTVTGNIGFDLTVIGFIITSGFFTLAVVRYDFINVTPIARKKVVNNVRDGMVVVDTDDTILDSNPSFQSLFGIEEGSLVGTNARTLLEDLPEIYTAYEELTSRPDEDGDSETKRVTYGDRHLNVQSSPVYDDRNRHVGWLLLVHDVTALVQRERDLEGQVEKLDQFAGIVSHDLRNPLNVAHGYVRQARETGDTTYLEKTESSMERMETIISEALELAREGEEVTDPERVELDAVARAAWDNVDTGAATLHVEEAVLSADRKRFQRLLENLFRNSLEHGVDETQTANHVVSVGYDEDGVDELVIYVADNGVGIPDDELETVFESGYTTNQDGTGLGLAIVEQIANSHGWTVAVTNSHDGGARFELHDVPKPVGE